MITERDRPSLVNLNPALAVLLFSKRRTFDAFVSVDGVGNSSRRRNLIFSSFDLVLLLAFMAFKCVGSDVLRDVCSQMHLFSKSSVNFFTDFDGDIFVVFVGNGRGGNGVCCTASRTSSAEARRASLNNLPMRVTSATEGVISISGADIFFIVECVVDGTFFIVLLLLDDLPMAALCNRLRVAFTKFQLVDFVSEPPWCRVSLIMAGVFGVSPLPCDDLRSHASAAGEFIKMPYILLSTCCS